MKGLYNSLKSHDAPSLKPTLRQERCSKVRFSGAACDKCIAGCPTDSIRIAQSTLTIDDTCSGCGFCVASCPNEVFAVSGTGPIGFTEEKRGTIYCSGLLAKGPLSARALPASIIPCLGSISTGVIVARILQDEKPLEVVIGSCEECPMRAGEQRYRQREKEIQSLFDYLGIGFPPVKISTASAVDRETATRAYDGVQAAMEKSRGLSRRDFFRHVRNRVVHHAAEPGKNVTRAPDSESARRGPFAERRSLVEIVRKYGNGVNGEKGSIPMFREVLVDENCIGCGACTNLCPTGALSLHEGPAEVRLTWTAAHCSSCDLCLDACVRKALHVLPCTDVCKIAGEVTSTVKLFQRRRCRACGNTFLSSGPDACAPGTSCADCSGTELFMDAVSAMIYGEERRASS